ncbi:MAG TPA: preprotein translocase subunit YajC [Polyangiaceae bacterium]
MGSAALALQQNVPPAPGRPETAPATAEPHVSQAPPPSRPAAEPGAGLSWLPLLLLVPLLLVMLFSSRSQQKKQQAAVAALKKGDRVLTQSGLVGKLVEVGDRYAKIEIAPGVKVDIVKSGLLGKDNPETAAAVEKK